MKILFLDVDGVLNRCGMSAQGLESDKVDLLVRIQRETGCSVVVSSCWRRREHQRERLLCLFRKHQIPHLGWTPYMDSRGDEIAAWLKDNPGWTHYAILDDNADMGQLWPRLVQTESFEGLTEAHANRVIEMLNEPLETVTIYSPRRILLPTEGRNKLAFAADDEL